MSSILNGYCVVEKAILNLGITNFVYTRYFMIQLVHVKYLCSNYPKQMKLNFKFNLTIYFSFDLVH